MPRKKEPQDLEEPSVLEKDLYGKVETFFSEEKDCDKTGSATSFPLSLDIFGGTIYPDVFGLRNPKEKGFQIYMAEGKVSFRGRNFDICKGQAITLQRFAEYVYVFFPKSSWRELDKREKTEIQTECKNLKLGLLLVGKDSCSEIISPSPTSDLLDEENRRFARDEIVHYFPNFVGPEENADFFERHPELADNIVKESCELVHKYLVDSFTKIMPVKKQSIKFWYSDDTFEFYLYSKVKNGEILLLMKPFGSERFASSFPTLLVQERYKSSIMRKKNVRQKLARHIEQCLKRDCKVDAGDFMFYGSDAAQEVLSHIEKVKPENFSIYERIKILGVEKEEITKSVEKALQKSLRFLISLK